MYNYQTERPNIFNDEGQKLFISIRDKAKGLLKTAGAFAMGNAITGHAGSTWTMLACVDRMIELGEIVEISQPNVPGQHRVFVASYRS